VSRSLTRGVVASRERRLVYDTRSYPDVLVLRKVTADHVAFELRNQDGHVRDVLVLVVADRPLFPVVHSEPTETTGDDALDEAIVRRAGEELVRFRASVAAARRIGDGVREELDAGYWDAA
jgi:hypothetical protein